MFSCREGSPSAGNDVDAGDGIASLSVDAVGGGDGVMRFTCEERSSSVGNDSDVGCLLYTSPSPRDGLLSRMPSSA